MKRNIIYVLFLMLLTLGISSCSQEERFESVETNNEEGKRDIVTLCGGQPAQTRMGFTDDFNAFEWQVGDWIYVNGVKSQPLAEADIRDGQAYFKVDFTDYPARKTVEDPMQVRFYGRAISDATVGTDTNPYLGEMEIKYTQGFPYMKYDLAVAEVNEQSAFTLVHKCTYFAFKYELVGNSWAEDAYLYSFDLRFEYPDLPDAFCGIYADGTYKLTEKDRDFAPFDAKTDPLVQEGGFTTVLMCSEARCYYSAPNHTTKGYWAIRPAIAGDINTIPEAWGYTMYPTQMGLTANAKNGNNDTCLMTPFKNTPADKSDLITGFDETDFRQNHVTYVARKWDITVM